ncbi:response regulator transcription factor [Chloroflexales bacterium ZM16-3]|nr:response regulator transcription factor [Chloroflexales bacterium ZM16-3]
MASPPTRIVLAEDEPSLRDFVSRNLSARGFTVFEATNGLEALSLWETERPQLLILDIMMPRLGGLEVCARVRAQSTVPILVLTALDAERDKVAALDLGADDYLTKPFGVEELLARVRAVLRRARWGEEPARVGPQIYGDLEIDEEARSVRVRGEPVRLTPTEFALLAHLAANRQRVVAHQELLRAIWGENYRDEVEYLRVFIGRLRRKIEREPASPSHLITEPGVGYRFMS